MPLGETSDMIKIGLFSELGYTTVGDKYVSCFASKNKQMMTIGSKMRSGLQDGYFDSEFKRIFEGDIYVDHFRVRRRQRMEVAKKNISQAFLPPAPGKKSSVFISIGLYAILLKCPAFQLGVHPQMAFDCNPYKSDKPLRRLKLKCKEVKKKVVVPFKPSSPAKKSGGMKCGNFDVFPHYTADPYEAKVVKSVGVTPNVFLPTSAQNSRPVVSLVHLNVKR
uniref:Cilia-and flagella-associated protein 96 n=1 Tax=Eptatretus burgeri TaxID=7764 RepID=A0A8C4NCF2_EPTBU